MVEEQVAQGDQPADRDEDRANKRLKLETAEGADNELKKEPAAVPAKEVESEAVKDASVESKKEAIEEADKEVKSESAEATGKELKSKSDNEVQEVSAELKSKIAKQIDYYFSDVNLIKDKFMKEQLEKNDNSVSLSVLATFSRLAQLTKAEEVIIDALRDFNSDYMELDAEKKVIRRKNPIPNKDELLKDLDPRTVHISGFPDSLKFDDLKRFFALHGEVESLSMRQHYKTKQFKGCIHIVFKYQSDAQKILESEKFMFKDRELRRESMEQYHKRKEDMKRDRMEKRKNKGKTVEA